MKRFRTVIGLLLLLLPGLARAEERFYLKDGDRVVFYGDSITDQRLYTTFTETYVVTRFPKWNVSFVHSGWGGDRVAGGGGGRIDLRLERDVIAYRPTVMTIMLGMNDASYRPFDQAIFNTYAKGYQHIIDKVKAEDPGIRFTLIVPSPFDDVTRPPNFEGGYNAVLLKYGDFVRELAAREGATVADLNTSVVAAVRKAHELDPKNSARLIADRVHPGAGGHLLMAEALLKAWNAPALVSRVQIKLDGSSASATGQHTTTSDVRASEDGVSWTQLDDALPFPIDLSDSITSLAARASDVVSALDDETLKVEGLKGERYDLKIDGEPVGTFTPAQLSEGINLATLPTPMAKQAANVHRLTLDHNNFHYFRWRQVQVPFQARKAPLLAETLKGLDALEAEIVAEQRAAAQPKPHKFELRPRSGQ